MSLDPRVVRFRQATAKVRTIDPSTLVQRVRRIAAREPQGTALCHYVDKYTMQPACIVGCALNEEGIIVEDLVELGYTGIQSVYGDVNPALHWLVTVQNQQDMGAPWARAVAVADERVEGVE